MIIDKQKEPLIAIITALPKEYAAMESLMENCEIFIAQGNGAGCRYTLGEIPTLFGNSNKIVLAMSGMGNNMSTSRATRLIEHFPNVRLTIMVGIAGGIPNPIKADEHVRLGDIVVSSEKGVIQYDFDKESINGVEVRALPRPPASSALEAVRYLQANEYKQEKPWIKYIDIARSKLNINLPKIESDILVSSESSSSNIEHPIDEKRVNGEPRLFVGPIASANKLLKNPVRRDKLRDGYGVKAIEMEASGIADASWTSETGYLIVRGICDYCDSNKGDEWQDYAAVVAAGFTRALIETIRYNEKKN